MQETLMDQRGRVTLGKKLAKRYGKRFTVVPAQNEIILVPKTKDPIRSLQEWGKKAGINKFSMKEIKKIISEEAVKELLSES
jgi:hypothetical protein